MKALMPFMLLSLMISVLTGCGFYLKGMNAAQTSNISELALGGAVKSSDLGLALQQQIQINAWSLSDQAPFKIDVISEDFDERRLTASQSVSQDEFTLTLTVRFILMHRLAEKDQSYGPITVLADTIFQGDETQIVSKDNEKNRLKNELRQQVAEQILHQVDIIALNPPACDCDHEDQSPAISQ